MFLVSGRKGGVSYARSTKSSAKRAVSLSPCSSTGGVGSSSEGAFPCLIAVSCSHGVQCTNKPPFPGWGAFSITPRISSFKHIRSIDVYILPTELLLRSILLRRVESSYCALKPRVLASALDTCYVWKSTTMTLLLWTHTTILK